MSQTPPPPPLVTKELQRNRSNSRSFDSPKSSESTPPPSPPIRQISSSIPPDVKPRYSSRSSFSSTSPIKQPTSVLDRASSEEPPERRKRSIDLIDDPITTSPTVEYAEVKKYSTDLTSSFSPQQAQPNTSSPSSGLSISSSPNHTEDEKQENESNEKTDLFDEIITECKLSSYLFFIRF